MLDAPDVIQERPEGCSHDGNGTGQRHCTTLDHATQARLSRWLSPRMVSMLTLHRNVGGKLAAVLHGVSLLRYVFSITHSHHKIHKIIFYCCIFAIAKINRTCMKKCWNLWYNETGAVIGLAECRTPIHTPTRPTNRYFPQNFLYAEQCTRCTNRTRHTHRIHHTRRTHHTRCTHRTKFHHCT